MAETSAEEDEIMESGEAADMESQQPTPLQEAQIEATIADATFRQKRDALVAAWRDWLHYSMQSPGAIQMISTIHMVMDSMDDFLNHRSRK